MEEPTEPDAATALPIWAERFFELRLELKTIQQASRAAGVTRQMVYLTRAKNEAFRERWEDVDEQLTDMLEMSMLGHAIEGYEQDVWHQGVVVGKKVEFEIAERIFMLRNRRPEEYNKAVGQANVGDALPSGPEVHVTVSAAQAQQAPEPAADGSNGA